MGMTDAELEKKMRGSDGGVRNFWKLWLETRKMRRHVAAENAKGTKDIFMNTLVEGAQGSPYAFGHYVGIYLIVSTLAIIGLVAALVVLI